MVMVVNILAPFWMMVLLHAGEANYFGEIGDGTTLSDRTTPVPVDLGVGRIAEGISLGFNQTCAILDDGSLKCWGRNNVGQLGDGTNTLRNAPVAVDLGTDKTATAISIGNYHTCAILNDNSVKCWGRNGDGRIGDGSTTDRNAPVPVDLGEGRTAVGISLGGRHTCAVLDNGSLVCWGWNNHGQVGDGSTTDSNTPVAVNLGDGTAVAVAAGYNHTCALLDDNSVVCWGYNGFGQLGDETIVNKNTPTDVDLGDKTIAAIQAGNNFTCALFEDGSVTCWGNNEDGQLGTGASGHSILSPQTVDTGDETVTAIDGGSGHSCGLFEDGDSNVTLKCWGLNDSGELGIGHTDKRISPVLNSSVLVDGLSLGNNHGCAIGSNVLSCWGENSSGQLGLGDTGDRHNPVAVNLGTGKTAKAVSARFKHTCAILNDDKIKCWGMGRSGRLGNGGTNDSNTPVAVTMDSNTAVKISIGVSHSCAIFDDDKVYCWGQNSVGQLGDGTTTNRNTPTVVDLGTDKTATAIRAGGNHACAILNDNSVKCWGDNVYGQVGDGSRIRSESPFAVSLGTDRTATAIHAKGDYTCAILDDGSLKCWGRNSVGQLGDGTTTNRTTPVTVDLGQGRTATAVGGGISHTCAILDDESLKCWGNNEYGKTGLPTVHRGDQPGEMGENLIFVDFDV